MDSDVTPIDQHYTSPQLLASIRNGLASLGLTPVTVSVDDLAAVDEFHIGGRAATSAFLDRLPFLPEHHVLDVGSGLGGAARHIASGLGCRVTGIDATHAFIEAGEVLSTWVGLDTRVAFHHGNACEMPFSRQTFDGAYMLHVGMNVPDKSALFREVHRVTKAGSSFGIYDVLRTGESDVDLPVPWASRASMNHAATQPAYEDALTTAGFTVLDIRDRTDTALSFFQQKRTQKAGDAPPLGLHLLMGEETRRKLQNMVRAVEDGAIAPTEIIASRQ